MKTFSRRSFLQRCAALSALAAASRKVPAWASQKGINERLNVAVIGPWNRGRASLHAMLKENVRAICDVEESYLQKAGEMAPRAEKFRDYRKLLETIHDLDGICVCTPDHTHAAPSIQAMRQGIHCYCEKPLAHNVQECRWMEKIAAEKKLVTQMGTQIHAGENYRQVVELVQSGAIGTVEEVHVWFGGSWSLPADTKRPEETPPVPATLDWENWIGPAPMRPYHPCYVPGKWRKWWAFGNGTMGDMACHYIDLPFWALGLKNCLTAEAINPVPVNTEGTPSSLEIRFTFPNLTLTWYDGGRRPALLKERNIPDRHAGVLFVGKEGILFADYTTHQLYPEEKFADFQAPEPWIPRSIGHHAEWLQAIRDNRPDATTCPFAYSGRLTETVLLGTVAFRAGGKIVWDADSLQITNLPHANTLLTRQYRPGWEL